jgi:lipopolysaccharide heptosyltransferase II
MNSPKTKVLIVKIGAIGDAVMALSMIYEIDKRYPNCEITWLCGDIILPLIKRVKRIDRVISLNENKLLRGSKIEQISVILNIWIKLFLMKFDLVINAHRDKRYDLLVLTTIKKEYRSFTGKYRKNQIVQGRYHGSEYARLVHNKDDWEMPEPVFPKILLSEDKEVEKLISESKGKRIILTPGGAQNLINGGIQRKWPIENYVALTKALITKFKDISIILAGSESDRYAITNFDGLPIINLIGRTSLIVLIQLYNKCKLLITHDTGLLHLAKLSEIHTIALFGPVNPVERVGKNERIDAIWLGNTLPCAPCYNGKSFSDCGNNICMKNISVAMVVQRTLKILEQ